MALSISQTATAVSTNVPASFLAASGTAPYSYSVLPNGAGGTINSSTGVYLAPSSSVLNPSTNYDTIVATDSLSATATSKILVGSPLLLFCDIIQNQMQLAPGRVFIWNEKIFEPTDSGLFIVLSLVSEKIIGNNNVTVPTSGGLNQAQTINSAAIIDVNIKSRGTSAIDRKNEILMAVNSTYARQQMAANSFSILINSHDFLDLSGLDGTAIPYRFKASFTMFYMTTKVSPSQYYSTFNPIVIDTNNP